MLWDDYSDEELCALIKQNKEKALQAIMLRYWEPLYKMALYTLHDTFLCEDIVQQVFIQIWSKRDVLNFRYSLKSYLFACTRYEVYRQIKAKHTPLHSCDDDEYRYIEYYNPHQALEYNELLENVETLVDQLPDRCREVYKLSRDHQFSHKQIAAHLNVSTKTVENQITIALKKIKVGLSKLLFLLLF
ncbi:RNA polymerase sigma factor [Sphingobacterium sp. SYP-B4668]|uniref:RNA polymerase sigma factor n=1 Tax=Sphingobacterium sp. SYP-B4668 TaxID=2996035 RepID=UPI0022DDCE05|nr:sigma-70 family RNA polymerase sigma factor [Sphingobacterium sp. SYP-B4668]